MTETAESFKSAEHTILWEGIAAPMRALRRTAGDPSYETIAEQTGLSTSTLDNIFNARKLVRSENVIAIAQELGGCPTEWTQRWVTTANQLKKLPAGPVKAEPRAEPDLAAGNGSDPTQTSPDQQTSVEKPGPTPDGDPRTGTPPRPPGLTLPSDGTRNRRGRRNGWRTTVIVIGLAAAYGAGVLTSTWFRGPERECATVTAKPSAPIYLEIGQPEPFKRKRYGEQVELYLALKPITTLPGTYQAVLIREGRNTYGWVLDTQITPAACTVR